MQTSTAEIVEPKTPLLVIDAKALVPADIFKAGGTDVILADIEKKVRSHIPDMATEDGRAAIKRMGRNIASAKIFLDDLGKVEVEDLKKVTGAVDKERKKMRDKLDALKAEIVAPVEAFDALEATRVSQHTAALDQIAYQGILQPGAGTALINERLDMVKLLRGGRDWQEFAELATQKAETTLQALGAAHTVAAAAEALAEENQRLRDEAARHKLEDDAKAAAAPMVEQATERAIRAEAEVESVKASVPTQIAAAVEADRAEQTSVRLTRAAQPSLREKTHRAIVAALIKEGLAEMDAVKVCGAVGMGKIPGLVIEY